MKCDMHITTKAVCIRSGMICNKLQVIIKWRIDWARQQHIDGKLGMDTIQGLPFGSTDHGNKSTMVTKIMTSALILFFHSVEWRSASTRWAFDWFQITFQLKSLGMSLPYGCTVWTSQSLVFHLDVLSISFMSTQLHARVSRQFSYTLSRMVKLCILQSWANLCPTRILEDFESDGKMDYWQSVLVVIIFHQVTMRCIWFTIQMDSKVALDQTG